MDFYEIIKESEDPIEEAINLQYSNEFFNDLPSIERIILEAIQESLRRIPAKVRAAVILRKEQYTYKEIAEKMHCSEKTARLLLKKAQKYYRDIILTSQN